MSDSIKVGDQFKLPVRIGDRGAVIQDDGERIDYSKLDLMVACIAINNHDRLVEDNEKLKKEDKRSFFSGVAVSLQAIAFFGDSAIAEEIVSGLGGDKEEFYEYLKSEGGVDLDTYRYLIKNNTADILSTFDAIECECGCDITQEVMSSEEGSFDCDCGAEVTWRGRNDN